ncbi:Hypothetical protein D9617_18g033260 [Elsinoe fawcettii]|nr:Hypothetical protein D9617_18g033260 [Elsinoe fawcettii]
MPRREHGDASKKSQQWDKPQLTHFLCLPLINGVSRPQLDNSIGAFRGEVSGDGATEGSYLVPASAIRPIGTLHLTLGVMDLREGGKLADAVKCLERLDLRKLIVENLENQTSAAFHNNASTKTPTVPKQGLITSRDAASPEGALETLRRPISPPTTTRPGPVSAGVDTTVPSDQSDTAAAACTVPMQINLTGLHPMQAPRATTIIYAQPSDQTNRLLPFASSIRQAFMDAGFVLPDSRPLRLHATIINTIYIKGRDRVAAQITPPKQDQQDHIDDVETNPATTTTSINEAARTKSTPLPSPAALEAAVPTERSAQTIDPNSKPEVSGANQTSKQKSKKRRPGPMKLDARALIEKCKDHVWARDIVIDRIAICEMGAKNMLNEKGEVIDQAYREVASVPIPYPTHLPNDSTETGQ